MNIGEARYRIARYAALAGMWARWAGRFGLPFVRPQDPARIVFCCDSRARLPELPWAALDEDQVLAEAETLVHSLSGAGAIGYWHGTAGATRCWPLKFFPSLARPGAEPSCDKQTAWTRSRLQVLVALGLVCRQSNNDETKTRALHAMDAILTSWLAHNPWLRGIHYLSTMECALRLISVCHALDLARSCAIPPDIWRRMLYLVHGHAYFIRRRLCLYSAAGNHTIGECAGLIYAGLLFPELPEAKEWLELGLAQLTREVDVQILADGGNREQSFRYLAMMTDLCGLVVALLRHDGRPVPAEIERAWRRACGFLQLFADAPDALPPVGDSDDGFALSPYLRLSWQHDSAQATSRQRLCCFETSGFSLIAGSENDGSLRFTHGNLGTARGFGHGHADALSVCWDVGGGSLLVDPGTYLYESDARFRRYFRSTAAHNTLVVDGRDQAEQEGGGPFAWSRPYASRLVWRCEDQAGSTIVLACHDGYRDIDVTHWRAVVYPPGRGWWIWDRVAGAGEHRLDLHWHIDAALEVAAEGYRLAHAGLCWYLRLNGGRHEVTRGDASRPLGWISRRYGSREPIDTITVSALVTLPHEFVTCISAQSDTDGDEVFRQELVAQLRSRCELERGACQ